MKPKKSRAKRFPIKCFSEPWRNIDVMNFQGSLHASWSKMKRSSNAGMNVCKARTAIIIRASQIV